MKSPKTSNFTFQQFLKNSKTWFLLEDQNLVSGQVQCLLSTRQHGDVAEGTPGKQDVLEGRRLKKEILSAFPGAQVELEHVDEWVQLEVSLPSGVRVAQVAPPPVAPSAEGAFYKNPQFKEVLQFAETGAVTNIPAVAAEAAKKDNLDLPKRQTVSDAKKAPPTPEEISHAPGGKGVSTLNRLVVDSVDPKAEKAIPGNEAKMPKASALEVNNSRMRAWLGQVYPR
jgi:hypothetical protein